MTELETVDVALGSRSYRISIGSGLLATAGAGIRPLLRNPRVAIVTESKVAGLHLDAFTAGLAQAGISHEALILEPGEATKSWEGLETAVEWLLQAKVSRDDYVVAFGGGVIGDLAGFAAAVLRRGVRFIQVPTTLLAQVDSSVGGKTGINSVRGKNLIGAFHQPELVIADVDLLASLDRRDYLAGYAEVAKYGLLGDAAFFDWLESNAAAAASGDVAARIHCVRRSCEMKAAIVARDETEQGERALLNLGHTFGHALEAATGYSNRLLHGEGVSIGCLLAFQASSALGFCSQELPSRVAEHFAGMGMKSSLRDIDGPLPDADGLLELMSQDKKVRDGKPAFILARDIGDTFVARDVDMSVIRSVLQDALAARSV